MAAGETARMRFGAAVRSERQRQSLSLEALADRMGAHWSWLGGVERGQRNPTLDSMEAVAIALGVPLATLLKED